MEEANPSSRSRERWHRLSIRTRGNNDFLEGKRGYEEKIV